MPATSCHLFLIGPSAKPSADAKADDQRHTTAQELFCLTTTQTAEEQLEGCGVDKAKPRTYAEAAAEAEAEDGSPEQRVSAPLGPGVLGYVATSGRALLLSDASIDQRFESRVDECAAGLPDAGGPVSLACAPLKDRTGQVHSYTCLGLGPTGP